MADDTLYKPKQLQIADRWRDYYNPLIGLRVRLITQWMFEYQQGMVSNLEWLYRFIERRDPTISACIARRTAAIKKLHWDIKTMPEKDLPEGFTMAQAEDQATFLQETYNRIDNISEAIEFLTLAQFRGFSHLEKHFDGDGEICHLEPVPQWNWARAGTIGDFAYNKRALQVYYDPQGTNSDLVPIDPENFVFREVARPIHEALIINWIRKSMNQKDWDAYIETYGLPSIFIELPEDAPMVGADVRPEYLAAAQQVASDARGVLPKGSKIIKVEGSNQGTHPFKDHISYIDEQSILVSTGGLLTMLTKSGSGTLAGQAHKDTFDELAEAEGAEITEVLQMQIDKLKLEEKFPLQPRMAWFSLETQESTDTSKVVDDVLNLKGAGLQVDIGQVEEKTGYDLTEIPVTPDTVSPPKIAKAPLEVTNRAMMRGPWARISNRKRVDAGKLATNAMKKLSEAQAEVMQDMLEAFRDEVLDGAADGLRNRWTVFQGKLPEFLKEMNIDPKTAKVFKDAFSTGYIAGLFQGSGKQPARA